MANSRKGFEVGFTGEKTAKCITMMFGVHGAEKVGGRLVVRSFLPAAPVHKQTMAEAAQHPQNPHGPGMSHPAVVFQVGHLQALVKSAFDAPGGPVCGRPLCGGEFARRQACEQGHGFRGVVAQVASEPGDLLCGWEADLFGACRAAAQDARLGPAFVEPAAGGQCWVLVFRGKNPPVARGRFAGCAFGVWVGCL